MPTDRKIIHIDCDCFFAAVEMRDDPSLRGRPVAVGGASDRRGVIATCNYEARRFGVHSALPTRQALQRCPQLVLIAPHFDRYKAASQQIHAIYRAFTARIEPLSLDEAYLDVSTAPHCQGSATRMAQAIRQRIEAEVGITASAGIAPNKFIAKVASDWNKPNGQFVVRPHEADAFVAALPVEKIFGVGKVTAARLHQLGAHTCNDLRGWSLQVLSQHFGRFGERLYQLCRGEDNRPVETERPRKSLSVENTYPSDLADYAACRAELPALLADLQHRLQRSGEAAAVNKAFVKIKFADFSQTTVECLQRAPGGAVYEQLLAEGLARRLQPVRLLGVGVRFADVPLRPQQLSLFDDPETPS